MRIFIEPDLLNPERDSKLLNTMKTEPATQSSSALVRIETKEDTKSNSTYGTSSSSNYSGYSGYSKSSYSEKSSHSEIKNYKQTPTYKTLTRFIYRNIKDVIVYSWASPNQNFSYLTVSMVMEPEFTTSVMLERLILNITYDRHEDIWILNSSLDKRGSWSSSNDTPSFIAERWCADEVQLLSEIKGALLFQNLNPRSANDLFLTAIQNIKIDYDEDNKVVLTRTANYTIIDDKVKNKENTTSSTSTSYSYTNPSPPAKVDDRDTDKKFPYDDDDWDLSKWGYG